MNYAYVGEHSKIFKNFYKKQTTLMCDIHASKPGHLSRSLGHHDHDYLGHVNTTSCLIHDPTTKVLGHFGLHLALYKGWVTSY